MATNTATLKAFAQQTRTKLISLITTKLQFVLTADTAELRGYSAQLDRLRKEIAVKTEKIVIEEVAYTWFNRVMALRFMDANGYNAPMVVTPVAGHTRPEILQDAMGGSFDEELHLSAEEKLLPEAKLYRKLLVAVCNQKNGAMPFLFERITDYTELLLPDDLLSEQSFVSDIRNGMSAEDCENVEIIGWLYQYYVSEENERLIKSKKKYNRNELAPASQLFTPKWIVRYMVDNTLGQMWSEMHPESKLTDSLDFYIKPDEVSALPKREVKSIEDIRFYDPCVGSAHILSYAYDLFYMMYAESGYSNAEIPRLIIEKNLWGTDIDKRAAQLSAFVLVMKARGSYSRIFRKGLLAPNISYYKDFQEDEKFAKASSLGSLITITPEELKHRETEEKSNDLFGQSDEVKHLDKLYQTLGQRYDLVVTNPPYISSSRMDDETKKFVEAYYPETKSDLFATFILRCLELCHTDGLTGYMTPFVWMFISSYEKLRKELIDNHFINNLIQLEYSGFDGATVPVCTFTLRNNFIDTKGCYIRLSDFKGSANQAPKTLEAINNRSCGWFYSALQREFEKIPGSPIGYWVSNKMIDAINRHAKVGDIAKPRKGLVTLKDDYFINLWYEASMTDVLSHNKTKNESLVENKKWVFCNKGGGFCKWYGMNNYIIRWYNDGEELKKYIVEKYNGGSYTKEIRSENLYFKEGITWGGVTSGIPSFRFFPNGFIFSSSGPSAFLDNNIYYLLGLLNSSVSNKILEVYSPTLSVLSGDIANLPYYLNDDKKDDINTLVNINIKLSKQDWDAHETSWDFKENELVKIYKLCTENRIRRLEFLYNEYEIVWKKNFLQLHANEEELNRQFIEIYGLQEELTPDVPLKEITILQQGEISIEENQLVWHKDVVIKQFISYLVGCYMGRYSVDKPGLIIASQGQDLSALGLQIEGMENTPQSTFAIDDDGIIPFIQEEDFFADDMTKRIEEAIKRIFGEAHYNDNLKFINAALGDNLRDYLYKNFYTDHVQMYKKRPIYWLFSSKMGDKKKKGYFKALVYMHRLEPDTLSKLHADYVTPYLNKVEQQLKEAEHEIDREGLTQAQKNKALKQVEEIRNKVREVRAFEQQLVEMASHRLTLDLDDGVKVNYPKFYPLVEPIKGLEGNDD